jgi:predicted ribosome quality control (RQC) complex YloA/Tae2 family protein
MKNDYKAKVIQTGLQIKSELERDTFGDVEETLHKAHNLINLSGNAAEMVAQAKKGYLIGKRMKLAEFSTKDFTATELREHLAAELFEEEATMIYAEELSKNIRAALDLIRSDISKYKEELNSSRGIGT